MGFDIPINIDLVDSSAEAIPSRTAYIDWEAGRIYGYVDGIEAMKQHVKKHCLHLVLNALYMTTNMAARLKI